MISMIGLSLIVLLVLVLPITVHKIEENLEIFLFVMGVAAVSISGVWNTHLILEALREPIAITVAVLILGFLSSRFNKTIGKVVIKAAEKLGFKTVLFLSVFLLGLISSVITAIVAAIILAEVTDILALKGEDKTKFVVLGCFSIGMGAVLTPIGEPLSTIVVAKLRGAPHYADFVFLFKMLAPWMLPGILFVSSLVFLIKQKSAPVFKHDSVPPESYKQLGMRGGKVYAFVAALVFLGAGLRPLAEKTILRLSDGFLYWANSVSAILDNATLAAIEIVPEMSAHKILFLLVGLILAGGLLIPGNIPNIICANKLKISSSSWAKFAIPLGVGMMVVYFILLKVIVG